MATYQAVYDYKNTATGMLTFRRGDKFTVRKKTNDDWWEVESERGSKGLVPSSYLELVEGVDGRDGGVREGVFTALYDFTGADSSQLSFKKGEQLVLQTKTDASWWTMKSIVTGLSGYVPLNYIDVPVETTASPTHITSGATNTITTITADGSGTSSNHGNSRPHPHHGVEEKEALSEVLLSVDRAMQKIHDEATLQGGSYTSQQRATLQQLATHRKSVVEENSSPSQQTLGHNQRQSSPSLNFHAHKNSTPSPSLTRSASHGLAANGSSSSHSSPRPRRKAPAPPTDHYSSLPRRAKNMKGSRSREDLVDRDLHPLQDVAASHRDRSLTQPPQGMGGVRRSRSGSQPSLTPPPQNHSGTAGLTPRPQSQQISGGGGGGGRSPAAKNPSPVSPHRGKPQQAQINPSSPQRTQQAQINPSSPQRTQQAQINPSSPQRTQQAQINPSSPQRTQQAQINPSSPQRSQQQGQQLGNRGAQRTLSSSSSSLAVQSTQESPGRSAASRSKSFDVHPHPVVPVTSSPSHQPRRTAPARTSSAGVPEERKKITLPPGLSPKSSPLTQRRHVSTTSVLETATPMAMADDALPTQFPSSDGADLIEVVRTRTQLSYGKSVQAVAGILEVLREKLPSSCTATMDGLLSAVQQSQTNTSPSSARKVDSSSDMARLKEIFFQLRDVREDSQQRGWAVHDDLSLIMEYLSELLQILCDADQEVTRAAVREDKYENILTLIGYYDIESRIPIRLLMLQVFGVLCGLDREVISVLLGSILPNELGRDINNHLTEIEKTLYSCTVCTMIFSTGEPIPLSVYDQWNEEYISFLLDTIESPPEEDGDEQLPDSFLNVILSFNQHFSDPESNPVMSVLKTKKDPRHFSEKFMFLINRGDDPVALQEPLCPDSLTKFALDLFSSAETSGLFYTTDLMVLIDIVLRQISDLCPGDEIRSHYLELLHRMVGSTDYRSHGHRQREITGVMNRISQEEGEESQKDRKLIKKIWASHPGCFDEVTDL